MASRAYDEAKPAVHSGKLLLRMPQSLHADLARAAEREGVSLNAFISAALAGAVQWRDPKSPGEPVRRPEPVAGQPRSRGRALPLALAVNLALVALAAAVAIALLVAAWP